MISNMISNFYSWFCRLYGQNLHDFLRGCDYDGTVNNAMNLYPRIFLTILGVTLLIAVFFYFFNLSVKFNKWWSWLIMLGVSATFAWVFGFAFTYSRYNEIPDCFKYSQCEYAEDAANYDNNDSDTTIGFDSMDEDEFDQSTLEFTRGGSLVGIPGTENLFKSSFVEFGFANAIISVILFVLFSLMFTWFSVYCKHCPFNFKMNK